jgi:hypothetical protein
LEAVLEALRVAELDTAFQSVSPQVRANLAGGLGMESRLGG